MSSSSRERRLALLTFAGLWLFLSYPWISGQFTIPYDAKALFQTQLQFLSNSFSSGQSPFWNPYAFGGLPQISDPQSLIFSPALPLAALYSSPPFSVLDIYVFALLGCGGLAILLLGLDRHWHPGAAVMAGICFSFGGSAAWRIQHIGHVQSYVFLAVSLWLLLRALDRRSALWAASSGVAAGAMLAAPNQVGFLGGITLAVLIIHGAFGRADPIASLRSYAVPVAAFVSAMLLISLGPVLLSWLFLSQSNRPSMPLAEAVRGSLHPASLLTFFVSDLFGARDPNIAYWGPYSEHWDKSELTISQNMSQIYFGSLPALMLIVFGIMRGQLLRREVAAYSIVALAAFAYALGGYAPVYGVLYNFLPGVSLFRRPVDATFVIGAMVSIMTGFLTHRWLTLSLPARSPRVHLVEVAVVVGILVIAAALAAHEHMLAVALKPLVVAIGWMLISALLLAVPGIWLRRGRAPLIVLPALILAIDLSINNAPNGSTAVEGASVSDVLTPESRSEVVAFLKENLRRAPGSQWRDRVELVGLGFDWQNCGAVHKFEGTLGYNPFRIGLVSRALGARDYIAGPDQRVFSPLFPSYRSKLADLIGLRFLATSIPVEQIDPNLKPGDLTLRRRFHDTWLYENPRVVPRVVFSTSSLTVDFEDILRDGRWPEFNPLETVLLEKSAPALVDSDTSPRRASGEQPGVLIERYENTLIEISTNSPRSGFVVLHDIWHPWWFARVDGRAAEIHRANVIFRAIQVPAGRHVIQLDFRPLGGAIAELGSLLSGRKP